MLSNPASLETNRAASADAPIGVSACATFTAAEVDALLEAERRRLRLALESADLGMWDFDPRTGALSWDAMMRRHFGLTPDEPITYERYIAGVHESDRAHTASVYRAAIEDPTRHRYAVRHRTRWADGTVRWVMGTAQIVRDSAGQAIQVIGVSQDITESVKAEERRRLLVRELDHRVKNNLATVQALVSQTAREGGDAAEFRAVFLKRLHALSRAHDLLTRSNWEVTDLAELAGLTVAPYGERVRVEGPPVRLSPNAALTLNLAVHELATNAAKYGALSNDDGRVAMTWTLGDAALDLRWVETGGPPVSPPERRGFGSRLLARGVANELGGSVDLEFAPEGVRCRVLAPLGDRVAAGERA